MKKKLIECPVHGLTLHRCKRRCWKNNSKDKNYRSEYIERCFKCMLEGRIKKPVITTEKKNKFISLRS